MSSKVIDEVIHRRENSGQLAIIVIAKFCIDDDGTSSSLVSTQINYTCTMAAASVSVFISAVSIAPTASHSLVLDHNGFPPHHPHCLGGNSSMPLPALAERVLPLSFGQFFCHGLYSTASSSSALTGHTK